MSVGEGSASRRPRYGETLVIAQAKDGSGDSIVVRLKSPEEGIDLESGDWFMAHNLPQNFQSTHLIGPDVLVGFSVEGNKGYFDLGKNALGQSVEVNVSEMPADVELDPRGLMGVKEPEKVVPPEAYFSCPLPPQRSKLTPPVHRHTSNGNVIALTVIALLVVAAVATLKLLS
jgi:hypothetical protein